MNPEAPCELLTWDTEFFGRRIGRVCGHRLNRELANQVDAWSRQHQIVTLYFLAASDDPETIEAAENHGFHLVDIRLTLRWTAPAGAAPPEPSDRIRSFEPSDLPVLQAIARASHTDTRFFSDRRFGRGQAEKLYETWIDLECRGRAKKVLVAIDDSGRPIGYISCHVKTTDESGSEGVPAPGAGQIGLLGVAAAARGQGVGSRLVSAALAWFMAQGLQQAEVVTQGNNLAAQRLYQRCGFVSQQVQFWYHKWYDAAARIA